MKWPGSILSLGGRGCAAMVQEEVELHFNLSPVIEREENDKRKRGRERERERREEGGVIGDGQGGACSHSLKHHEKRQDGEALSQAIMKD